MRPTRCPVRFQHRVLLVFCRTSKLKGVLTQGSPGVQPVPFPDCLWGHPSPYTVRESNCINENGVNHEILCTTVQTESLISIHVVDINWISRYL